MKYSLVQGVNGLGETVGKVVNEDGACIWYHPRRGVETVTIEWMPIEHATHTFEEIQDYIWKQQEFTRLGKLRVQVSDVKTVQEVEWI